MESLVPVKVELVKLCGGGGTDTTRSLYVTYLQGVVGETILGTEEVAMSVSNADTGNLMRVADGGYIYNWSTKPLTIGLDYTLRIRLDSAGGPIIQEAVIRAKK